MNYDNLKGLIEKCGSFKAAALEFGCSPGKIRYWAMKYNIDSPAKLDERKYKVNDNFLNEINYRQAYFLGLMAADGCIRENLKCKQKLRGFSISQSGESGLDIIKYIKHILDSESPIGYSHNSYSLYVSSEKIAERMFEIGITPRKTYTLSFPTGINPEFYSDYMRGYVDGDGSIGIYKRGAGEYLSASFVGTKEFMYGSENIIPNDISYSLTKIKKCSNLFQIQISGKSAEKFCAWIWDNSDFKSYKFDVYQKWMNEFNPPYRKYAKKKEAAKLLYENGVNPFEISKKIDVAFQTIYKWKNKDWK